LRLVGRLALSTVTFLAGVSLPTKLSARKATPDATPNTTPTPISLPPDNLAYLPLLLEERAIQSQPPTLTPSPARNEWDSVPQIPPLFVSTDRVLLTVGNTVYMVDSHRRVVWQWPAGKPDWWPFNTAQPLVIGDRVYVVGMDLTYVALDLNTGKEKWHDSSCGRGTYAQLAKFGGDQHLLLVDMSGYELTDKDRLEAYDMKNNELWDVDFPRGATLQVWNGKIYAVSRASDSIKLQEIKPPKSAGRHP
jgi:hypothetical protein